MFPPTLDPAPLIISSLDLLFYPPAYIREGVLAGAAAGGFLIPPESRRLETRRLVDGSAAVFLSCGDSEGPFVSAALGGSKWSRNTLCGDH